MSRTDRPEVVFIAGSGRSGTSWLGELIRSSGLCTYKYEPFSPAKKSPYHRWALDLLSTDPERHRARFFEIAQRGYFDIDRPPFAMSSSRLANRFIVDLYRSSGRLAALRPLFTALARPSLDRPILIKDVWFPGRWLGKLEHVLEPKMINIVRHPHATVASTCRGRSLGVWNPDIEELRDRIRFLDADDLSIELKELVNLADSLNEVELEALRWRLEAEITADFARLYELGHLVVYERLVRNTIEELGGIFEFLGWPFTKSTRSFIERSQTADSVRDGRDNYFSVRRDPSLVLTDWRQHITDDQLRDVDRVVGSSWLLKLWSDHDN